MITIIVEIRQQQTELAMKKSLNSFLILSLFLQHYRPANNGSSSGSGAPPPYPGRGGPGHGYGNGRGHYNRASNHPAEFNQLNSSRPSGSGHQQGQGQQRDHRDQRR